ncbi:MAG TPA: FAD-dependent oxidoreductase [Ilumatobacteraceae bacterium]
MESQLPARAQVVIVGGGVVGCSVAYHLACRGWTDVVLLERNQLTSGTTWHAAGLITTARPTSGMRQVVKRAIEVFKSLEADTGLSTGWEPTGTLHLATNADRWEELKRQASTSKYDEIDIEVLDVDATLERWPLLSDDGLVGSLFYPGDGRGNATDTTMSLSRGARQRGVQIFENTPATAIRRDRTRVTAVEAGGSVIECEYVVDCAGMWGREIAALAGVQVPLQALAHYYVVTEAIPGLARGLPTIKSSDDWMYVKNEGDGLMVGFFEPGSYPWQSQGIPGDAAFVHLPEDWDHLGPFYEQAMHRIPALATAGIRLFFGGPESFTPDGVYHCGEAPNLQNFFVAAGFNSTGFLTGPGIGSVLADWLVDGRPSIDLPEADPRRVMPHETNRRFLEQRVKETLDVAYDMHWPYQQRQSARPLRRSPLYERTAANGAVFGELLGWERPNWYAPDGVAREYVYSYGRQNWFEHSAAEHRAVRESVGLFDISTYGKFLVQGRDALQTLQRISVADVDVECGRIVYTQWLNRFGGIEADLTVTRLGDREFLVLSAPATAVRDLAWLRGHIADHEFTTVADVSGTMAMIAVMGPAARELLQPLTDCDLSNDAFPFATSREIDLGLGFVRATRITYVGELGWELLVPHDIAAHIYDVVIDAGARPAGYHALNSLRIEKGYRSWGHDISSGDSPLQAGLGFTVAWDKPGGFIGRDALVDQRGAGVDRRLVQFALDDPEPLLFHGEPIIRDGECVGHLTSAMYGHTIGASVGMGYVHAPSTDQPRDWFAGGCFSIEVAGQTEAARASLQPLYDPSAARTRM